MINLTQKKKNKKMFKINNNFFFIKIWERIEIKVYNINLIKNKSHVLLYQLHYVNQSMVA